MNWSNLDPSGNNFLGMGSTLGRIMAGIGTAGGSEFHRTDPFSTAPGSAGNHMGRAMGGIGPGALGGFVTGGVPGAFVGGATGGGLAGSGATNSTTLSGFGENLGAGAGAGGLTGYAAGSGLFSGGGSGAGGGASSAPSASSGASPVSKALNYMRMAPQGGSQQQTVSPAAAQASKLKMILQMMPGLRPGGQMGQSPQMGGMQNG